MLLVYAAYAKAKEAVGVNCTIIGFADVLAGFVAAIAVLSTVYALSPSIELAEEALAAGNLGLTFIYVVELLAVMPGSAIIAPLFFLALSLAAISSFIAMIELITTNVINFGIDRKKAAIYAAIATFIFRFPSALNIDFIDITDWVWGVGLLISRLVIAVAMMKYGVDKARIQINETSDLYIGGWWSFLIRIIPLMFVVIFSWWVVQPIEWYPDTWWHPFEVFSTGPMVFQWFILFIVCYALNNFFAKNVVAGPRTKNGR